MTLRTGYYEVEFTGSAIVPVSVGDILLTGGQSNSLAIGTWRDDRNCGTLTHSGVTTEDVGWACGVTLCEQDMLGDFLSRYETPIAFVATGLNGKPIAAWDAGEARERLFRALHMFQPRAVLWHQGESDGSTNATVYKEKLATLILESQSVVNATWIVAQVTDHTAPAQREVTHSLHNVFQGPDTRTTLRTPAYTSDNVHFTCAGLSANARLWRDSLLRTGVLSAS